MCVCVYIQSIKRLNSKLLPKRLASQDLKFELLQLTPSLSTWYAKPQKWPTFGHFSWCSKIESSSQTIWKYQEKQKKIWVKLSPSTFRGRASTVCKWLQCLYLPPRQAPWDPWGAESTRPSRDSIKHTRLWPQLRAQSSWNLHNFLGNRSIFGCNEQTLSGHWSPERPSHD